VGSFEHVKLLKPTGHVMHHQFKIQQLYALPTLYLRVFTYLRTNSDLCHLQHKLIGFYNRDDKCLQRGTDWVFKQSSLRFVFKGLINRQFCRRIKFSAVFIIFVCVCVCVCLSVSPSFVLLFYHYFIFYLLFLCFFHFLLPASTFRLFVVLI
jgi:hypothetical protein